jgi:hypothetical protein
MIALETLHSTLAVDSGSGSLLSFRAKAAPEQEFIQPAQDHPAFLIQYFDEQRQYQLLKAQQAEAVETQVSSEAGAATVTTRFSRVGGFDLDVITRVRASPAEPFSRWQITVQNRAGLEIVDVQYPMVVCAYQLGGKPASEALLQPNWIGELIQAPNMERLGPDSTSVWQLNRDNGSFAHYPGGQFAQFLAYFNNRAGLYLACEDTHGNVKRFKAVHRHPGLRLGVAHIGDWPAPGDRTLEYDVVLETFQGDWYAAAGMYRDWSLRQHWAVPLHRRTDIPAWLLDSPPYITIRPQGVLDAGPVYPIDEFLPYEKCIPLLERISARVQSPLVAVMMGWERGASWVYPDCFPPVGGDDSMRAFARQARGRGWHVGSFCNGTRWVMAHHWNGYDGRTFFRENGGAESICRLPDGQPWAESWDVSWRPSFQGCMGTAKTRQVAADFVRHLIDWGMESIQFFDQNCGATTFPCFARDHDHPALPGKWMAQKMADTVAAFHAAAAEAGEEGIIHSTETCCNEFCLPLFQEADSRLRPPGHFRPRPEVVPLYQFLFHECIVLQGGMGFAPEPYHMQIRSANNGVTGEIPGGVLTGDGTLLDKDTDNWANWEPKVGSDFEALEMIRVVTTLRREAGRPYLLYGRMQPPAAVRGVKTMRWKENGQAHAIPAVFHAAWRSPGGRHAVVLANWTNQPQPLSLRDPRLKKKVVITVESAAASLPADQLIPVIRGRLALTLPPLSIVLVECAG